MDLIYIDYNCFQRGFDDPLQTRIQMEALACQDGKRLWMIQKSDLRG